jgi:large subunit ribosomal protein L32e
MTDLKKVKKIMKAKKPKFRRQEAHRKKLPSNWRRPKGHHSKVRVKRKWKPKRPSLGYRTPASLRGYDKTGKKIVHIYNLGDIENMSKDVVYIVSTKLGLKKKKTIAERVKGKGFTFKNFNPEKILEQAKARLEKKKPEVKKKPEKKKLVKPKKAAKPAKPSKPKKKGGKK